MSYMFFFKQKTAYVLRISDWSSDVCSSDLVSDAGPQCLTTLALYYNGKLHTNATYVLSGTPCQQVFNRGFHFVGRDLLELYPNDSVMASFRSEERSVGTECVSTCSSRWSTYHLQTKSIAQSTKTNKN